jgi:hypothetical protein
MRGDRNYRGDKPLYYDKEERYAQERAYGYRQREAARRAGLDDYTGIFAKYERKMRVQQRISFLRRDDLTNEFHRAKRQHLEERLELVAFGNLFEFVVIGDDGKPRVDWKALAESDLGATIAELRMDKETGHVVHMARDSAMAAIGQLREMRGFKAQDRVRLEVSQVDQLSDEELVRIAAGALEASQLIEAQALPAPRDDEDEDDDAGVGAQETQP